MSQSINNIEEQFLYYRQSVDIIDENIIKLLAERSKCVAAIAEIKYQKNLSVFDAEREKHIIDQVFKDNPTLYQATDVAKIFRSILRAGVNQQLLYRADVED